MWKLIANPVHSVAGEVSVPGDKSISHRSVLFGALANGKVVIENFLMGEDCLHTVDVIRQLGVTVEVMEDSRRVVVHGVGYEGLREPNQILDVGNAGTLIRIGSGLLAACPFFTIVTGDESILQRPMGRIVEPLTRMGAEIRGRAQSTLAPLAIKGGNLRGITYSSKTASAQVKSAILLAGLLADSDETVVEEPQKSRDHTERMLSYLGADISVQGCKVRIRPQRVLQAKPLYIPGDISSAAFLLVLAALKANPEVIIRNVGYNASRAGIIEVLKLMGGQVEVFNVREWNGESLADIRVTSSQLVGGQIDGAIIPNIIDEIPVIALLATQAKGRTIIRDAAELRVKESDRIRTIVNGLQKLGAKIEELPDGMIIDGPTELHGGVVDSYGDHRIAMALSIAGLVASGPITVNNTGCVRTSFPGFAEVVSTIAGKCAITESSQIP